MPASDLELEQLRAVLAERHGDDLHLLEHDGHQVIVKGPTQGEWKRFMTLVSDPARRAGALDTLLRGCCVWVHGVTPGAGTAEVSAALTAMLEIRPGLAGTFGNELVEIAGLSNTATRKKL